MRSSGGGRIELPGGLGRPARIIGAATEHRLDGVQQLGHLEPRELGGSRAFEARVQEPVLDERRIDEGQP